MTEQSNAWKEILLTGVSVALVLGVIGHFGSSCEASKHRMLSDCLRSNRSAAECKLMEIAR
jgi:hypothetical protein